MRCKNQFSTVISLLAFAASTVPASAITIYESTIRESSTARGEFGETVIHQPSINGPASTHSYFDQDYGTELNYYTRTQLLGSGDNRSLLNTFDIELIRSFEYFHQFYFSVSSDTTYAFNALWESIQTRNYLEVAASLTPISNPFEREKFRWGFNDPEPDSNVSLSSDIAPGYSYNGSYGRYGLSGSTTGFLSAGTVYLYVVYATFIADSPDDALTTELRYPPQPSLIRLDIGGGVQAAPAITVPDSGATLALFSFAMLGVAALHRRLAN